MVKAETDAPDKKRVVGYWLLTGVVVLALVGGGVADLLRAPTALKIVVQTLHYPPYLLTILGVAKLIATAVLLAPGLPRLKEWAYAGVEIDMVGAAASHVLAGDAWTAAIPPVVVGLLALGSWVLRPASRYLPSPVAP